MQNRTYISSPIFLCLAIFVAMSSDVAVAQESRCKNSGATAFECSVETDELVRIKEFHGVVSRSGQTLRIKASDGTLVELVDVSQHSNSDIIYVFAGRLPNTELVIVDAQYWEGSGKLLVDLRNGKIVGIGGIPVLSPNKKRIASYDFGGVSGYSASAIRIHRQTPNGLVLEWSLDPPWTPSSLEWLDDSTILFIKNHMDRIESDPLAEVYVKEPSLVIYSNNQWRLE